MNDIMQALLNKGLSLENIQVVLEALADLNMVSAEKEYGIKNLNTGKVERLASTTLDYSLPESEIQRMERLFFISGWVPVAN